MKKYSKYTKEELEDSVRKNTSLSDVMRSFGLIPRGSNYHRFKAMLKHFNIDTSHFRKKGNAAAFIHHTKETFIRDVLVLNGKHWGSYGIKKKLLEYGLLENSCALCGQGTTWNGRELRLQLDHINGDHRDNRLGNLRILCPNCHSQTDTFCCKSSKNLRSRFTEMHLEKVKKLRNQGLTMKAIGEQLGFHSRTIGKYLQES